MWKRASCKSKEKCTSSLMWTNISRRKLKGCLAGYSDDFGHPIYNDALYGLGRHVLRVCHGDFPEDFCHLEGETSSDVFIGDWVLDYSNVHFIFSIIPSQ